MTPTEKQKKQNQITGLLAELISEFMYFVKQQSDNDREAEAKTNTKFKDLDQKWQIQCKTRDCRLLDIRNDAFRTSISMIVEDESRNKVPEGTKIITLESNFSERRK